MNKQYLSLLPLLLGTLLLFSTCEDKDQGNNNGPAATDTIADAIGNLVLVNQTNEALLLFVEGSLLREIPPGGKQFLVNIEGNGDKRKLSIYKKALVTSLPPPESVLYKRSTMVFTTATADSKKTTWVISADDSGSSMGSVSFSYPELDGHGMENIYSVDVFLEYKQGSYIVSLAPGTAQQEVLLGYKLHTLYFYYWYSDPNQNDGEPIEVGWMETNSQGNAMRVLINKDNLEGQYDIPIYQSTKGKYGELVVDNQTNRMLLIKANGNNIEGILKPTGESTDAVSYVAAGKQTTFLIPEGEYNFTADDPETAQVVYSLSNRAVAQRYSLPWQLGGYSRTVRISNATGGPIVIFANSALGSFGYTGYAIAQGQTIDCQLPENLAALYAQGASPDSLAVQEPVADAWTVANFALARPHPFEMVEVAGGTFTMGCTGEQSGCGPAHSVTVGSFSMGKYEVTQQQWLDVMGTKPSYFDNCDDCPVERVSWNDVQAFLTKLNEKYPGHNFRLPTEAEWEYAARGGVGSDGHQYAGSNTLGEVAWYRDNSYSLGSSHENYGTNPVGQKQANELGIYDMSGNVWEWCSDWYASDYYSNSVQADPQGPSTGSNRVLRGGSFYNNALYCLSAYRNFYNPSLSSHDCGFRLCRTVTL